MAAPSLLAPALSLGQPFDPTVARDLPGVRHKGSHALISQFALMVAALAFAAISALIAALVIRKAMAARGRAHAEAETATSRMKRAETRAAQAEQSRAELLALLDREVRSPLNGVVGALGLLQDLPLAQEPRNYADQARRHADAVLWSVDDVLDAARLDAGTLTRDEAPLDLVELSDGVARSIAGRVVGRDVAVGVAYGPGVPRQVVGDRYLLRRALAMLLGHAAMHTDQAGVLLHLFMVGETGGRVTVRFELRPIGGGGAPAGWFDKFPEFARGVFRGLVATLAGSFETDPIIAPDGAIKLSIPLGSVADRRGPATSAGSVVGVKLLVVNDHPGQRAILRKQLEPFGVMVVEAADAPSALDCIELAKLSGRQYDAAVIAETMPVIDGATLARRIRDLPEAGSMRLIASAAPGREAGASAAFDVCLTLPIGQQALHAALAPVAHGHAMQLTPVAATPAAPARQLRVLLIERNPVHQMLASMMLSREGHAVDVATHGSEAVGMARAAAPDVVLIDLLLTDRDGVAVGRRLRADLGAALTAPVIAMAEPSAPRALAEEIAAGVVDIVAKPIDKNQLFAAIARTLPPLPAAATAEPETPSVDVGALRDLAAQLDALKAAVSGDGSRESA